MNYTVVERYEQLEESDWLEKLPSLEENNVARSVIRLKYNVVISPGSIYLRNINVFCRLCVTSLLENV